MLRLFNRFKVKTISHNQRIFTVPVLDAVLVAVWRDNDGAICCDVDVSADAVAKSC